MDSLKRDIYEHLPVNVTFVAACNIVDFVRFMERLGICLIFKEPCDQRTKASAIGAMIRRNSEILKRI